MNCPECSAPAHRILQVNNTRADRTVRQRSCRECGHRWFTVELEVSKYAVYWQQVGERTSGKPQVKNSAEMKLSLNLENIEND
jgi:transcriptional regulator NrdR family protein